MAKRVFGFGWKKSDIDPRDRRFLYALPKMLPLPPLVDLRPKMPPVYDQGPIGSCTANATAAAVQFLLHPVEVDTPWFPASRLMIYYNTRLMEGTVGSDSGGQLRDAIKSVATYGVCAEDAWPYSDIPADAEGNFPEGCPAVTRPSEADYVAGAAAKAISYHAIAQDLQHMKACLTQGFPFVLGFTVYSSMFDVEGNPVTDLPMPKAGDAVEGGHAVVAVGYNDVKEQFTIRNSWGEAVQDKGHFYMPYGYLTDSNLSSDFWTIRKVAP